MNNKQKLGTIGASAIAALLTGESQGQVINPLTTLQTTPPAPILVMPHDNAVRAPGLNEPDLLAFTWKSSDPTQAVDYWVFHLCRASPTTGTQCECPGGVPCEQLACSPRDSPG